MNGKRLGIVLLVCMLTCAKGVDSGPESESALQVYLLRDVAIDRDVASLGQVSIIRGEESLVARAGKIALGRISLPGQRIVVDRNVLLSRLASSGIPASQVRLTGAEQTAITRRQRIIRGSEFIELARSYLGKNPPSGPVCQLDPVRIPEDLAIDGRAGGVELIPRLAKSNMSNQAVVRISVLVDGKQVDAREVGFRTKYNSRQAVTLAEVQAGTAISPGNVRMEDVVSDNPQSADRAVTYGLVARRLIPANTVIRPNMVGPVEPQVVVRRNQSVVIRVERFGLLVTAMGRAMEEGKTGEFIKVRNVDSQRIIMAKVKEDGTVEPGF